jgi:hypothetical protein
MREGKMINDQEERTQIVLYRLLLEGMKILRDDSAFDAQNSGFGTIRYTGSLWKGFGSVFRYDVAGLPDYEVELSTGDDPDDYRPDRQNAKIVPLGVEYTISPGQRGITASAIQSLLQLENYWISDEEIRHGNELKFRSPQTPDVQTFRYRSKKTETSKFPVDIEIRFYNPSNGSSPPELLHVSMRRAYPILSPAQREQRRLEQEKAKREKYGYMNLRTGMLCPETGWWEGWTAHNSTDKEVVRAGSHFPLAQLPAGAFAPDGERLVKAQWMWHGPYNERRDS